MNSENLQQQTERFAKQLNAILSQVISTHAEYELTVLQDTRKGKPRRSLNLMHSRGNEEEGVPLIRSCDDPANPVLFIRSRFTVELDSEEDTFLKVMTSTMGLWIDPTKGRKNPRPLVRVEYDREKEKYPSSHVHLHSHSSELGWIYGSSGQRLPLLQDIHFPAGGGRFRPTLEDFLLFLDQEKIFTDWKEGYKDVLRESRSKWEQIQARATTRRYPQEAAEVLERLGYRIIPPDQS